MKKAKSRKAWSAKKFQSWSIGFTATALKLITSIWGFCMIYAAVAITLAIFKTGEFSYLDTYIMKVCDCFMAAVVTGFITRVIGNIFQFNNGPVFGTSVTNKEEENNDSTSIDVYPDSMRSDDESNYRGD